MLCKHDIQIMCAFLCNTSLYKKKHTFAMSNYTKRQIEAMNVALGVIYANLFPIADRNYDEGDRNAIRVFNTVIRCISENPARLFQQLKDYTRSDSQPTIFGCNTPFNGLEEKLREQGFADVFPDLDKKK